MSVQYQAFFLVEDDIMDGATKRRGQDCWYRQNNIGLSAINDGILLEQSIFQLLRTHFKDKECYLNLIETFHEVSIIFTRNYPLTYYITITQTYSLTHPITCNSARC